MNILRLINFPALPKQAPSSLAVNDSFHLYKSKLPAATRTIAEKTLPTFALRTIPALFAVEEVEAWADVVPAIQS
jgi:hypothetical protein